MKEYEKIISQLGLIKHPEGGYFRETYRSGVPLGDRDLATSIYYLLPSGEVSRFHSLKSDEVWYYHSGSTAIIHIIDGKGNLEVKRLGNNFKEGENFQVTVHAGSIFGVTVKDAGTYSLLGCMVTPGFHFDDFRLYGREELVERFPEYREIIMRLT